jgi:small subunit ribosomal protein S20
MANIKSQIKRNRQNERARERNRAVRSEIRTRTKHAEAAMSGTGEQDPVEATRLAIKRIDEAAASGVLHKNTAARKTSRLMKRLNQSQTQD